MPKSINVSPASYSIWLRLVFDHPTEAAQQNWLDSTEFRVSNSTRLVEHMTRLCREFKTVAADYSLPQINQGIWFLLSATLEFGRFLADAEVPLDKRLECVRSMFWVYADFVAPSEVEEMENCFDMWWDMVCGYFWNAHLWRLKGDEITAQMQREDEEVDAQMSLEEIARCNQMNQILAQLQPGDNAEEALQKHGFSFDDFPNDDSSGLSTQTDIEFHDLPSTERQIMDTMLETLTKILYLHDMRCEGYALHGLNHLNHPQRTQTVQQFINARASEWDEDTLKWVESCRDGKAM